MQEAPEREEKSVIPLHQKMRKLLITFCVILTIHNNPIQIFETVTFVTLMEVRDPVGGVVT